MEMTEPNFTYTDTFELTVWLGSAHGTWCDKHRFLARPEPDTIKALLAVGVETFLALYDEAPDNYSLGLEYLFPGEEKSAIAA